MAEAKGFFEALKTFWKSGTKSVAKAAARWGVGGAKGLKATDRRWIEWLKTNDKAGRFVNMGKDATGKNMWKDTLTNAKLSSKGAARALYESGVKGGFTPTFKQASKDLAKASMNAAKASTPHVKAGAKTAIKGVEKGAGWAKSVLDFAFKHPFFSTLAVGVAYRKTGHNDGLINGVGKLVGSDNFRKNGLIKETQNLFLGVRTNSDGKEVDTPLLEMLVDSIWGYGTYDKLGNKASNAGNELVAKLEAMKEKGGEAGEWAKEQLTNLYNGGAQNSQPSYDYEGNMMVKDTGTGRYVDNTTQQYPSLGGQAAGSVMNSLNNAANYVSGQNVNKMDIASLLMSAFLFARGGWITKAGSAVLGGVTMHNINKREPQAQQQYARAAAQTAALQQSNNEPLYYPHEEEEKATFHGLGK